LLLTVSFVGLFGGGSLLFIAVVFVLLLLCAIGWLFLIIAIAVRIMRWLFFL
jgi:hypothetical protein